MLAAGQNRAYDSVCKGGLSRSLSKGLSMEKLDERARQDAIAAALERVGRARVGDLSREFGVSEVTIRKDLTALENRGELRRVHGGATRSRARDAGAFSARLTAATERKKDIARRAAKLVRAGSTIVVDSSSSAYYLARHLVDVKNLTVITSSLPTASLLLDASSATVHLLGGVLNRSARAVTEVESRVDLTADLFFGGAHAASPEHGLNEPLQEEASAKRALAMLAPRRYALLASSKFGHDEAHPWLAPDELTGIFTDADLPPEARERWAAAGVKIDRGRL